jgi:autotransporter-associated beta strand protein
LNLFGTAHGGEVVGSELYFAGGGGGASHRSTSPLFLGEGGLGGGGGSTTATSTFVNGVPGAANTGGGGGASKGENVSGAAGGTGVVIIRYSVLEVGQNGPDQVISDTETSGFTGLRKVDTNTVVMTGNNNFSGVSITGGTLLMGDNGTSGSFGDVNPRVDANTFFGINRSDDITYNNLIIGQGGFVHRGDGKTTFTQRQTYTGGTFVDNGTLVVAGGTPSGGTGGIVDDVIVNEGASLEYADIRAFGYGNGESVTSLTINGGSVGNNFYNYFWNASSTFPINLNGGTLVLGGAATSTTANQFLSPIITVGAGSPSQINRADGNTTANLRLRDGSHLTVNTVAGSKLFINVPVTSMSGTTDGAANGQLIKSGTGALVLNSANLYTGATTINEGTLEVNGSINSAITMSSSGIIAGNGTLSSVSLRGTVSPGSDGTGTLTTGNVTLAGNTAYVLDLDNADDVNGVPGTDWDLLQVNGTLTLGSHEIIIELQGSPGDFSFLQEYSWKILSANSISGFNANNWTVNTVGFSAFTGNALWTIERVGNDIFLKFEPKSIVWPGVGSLNGVDLTQVNDNFIIDSGKTLIVEIGAPIDYLVVAGGGSGAGRDVGGGGGGGGVLSNLTQPNPNFVYLGAGTYNVSVGAGGIGTNDNDGINGQNSVFGPFTAIGGGGGGYFASFTAPLGGSGGGGGRQGYFGGPGVRGQGFAGGNGSNGNTALYDAGGGGGGAGGVGQTAIKGTASTQGKGGDGGPGVQIDFTGTAKYFGGGGGGAPHRSSSLSTMISGLGGIGGGGNAAVNSSSPPQAGQPNTGGGGGASRSVTGNLIIGGNGGSGIVQVRYPAPAFATGGTTMAGTGSANGFTIHSFTQNGAATFTIPEDGLKTTYLGLLDGPGNFEYDSQGILEIAANQSYTGTSAVKRGELKVNADIRSSSGLTVSAGAILSGTGNLPSIEVFGKHRPGNSPGVQRVQGSASYRKGSIIEWELSTNAIGHRGLDYDGIDVIGDLVFEKGSQLQLVFDDATSEVNWEDAYWTEESPKRWKLFELTANSRVEGLTSLSAQMFSEWKDALGRHFETVHPDKEIQMQLIQETNGIYVELRVVNKANISFHSQETEK